jgi:hypothetical protein
MYNLRLPKQIALRNHQFDAINVPSFNVSYMADIDSIPNDYFSQAHSWAQSRKPSIGNNRSAYSSLQLNPFHHKRLIFKATPMKAHSSLQSTQNTITVLKEMLRRLDKKPIKVIYNQTTQLTNISKLYTSAPVKSKYDNFFNKYSNPLKLTILRRNKLRTQSNVNTKPPLQDDNPILSKITVTRKKRMSGFEESISFDAKKIVDQYKEMHSRTYASPFTNYTNPKIAFARYKRSCISINYNS